MKLSFLLSASTVDARQVVSSHTFLYVGGALFNDSLNVHTLHHPNEFFAG